MQTTASTPKKEKKAILVSPFKSMKDLQIVVDSGHKSGGPKITLNQIGIQYLPKLQIDLQIRWGGGWCKALISKYFLQLLSSGFCSCNANQFN